VGEARLGTRCEIKNLNSFLFMEQAIEFEARRQIELLEDGGTVVQETRLFDPDKGETRAMRTKEDAHDYRYFPDPDLLPLVVTDEMISRLRAEMPELPAARRERLISAYALTPAQAGLLTSSIETSRFALAALAGAPVGRRHDIANWISGPLSAKLNEANVDISASRVTPEDLVRLAQKVEDGTLSGKMAKEVLDALWAGEGGVDEVIRRRGLKQISDAGALEKIVADVLAQNATQVEDYRAGKAKAFNALVGQVMKATQGKANPAQVNALLKAKLAR
jgi:aspartyl-tRNA(Asn)/glutamyl-tRNA(Gln) amidotransferase subunit B